MSVPLDMISRDPRQARRHFDESALDELAASITTSGVVQPIILKGDAVHGYQLLAGERRWRAAQRAGLTHIPALVRNDLNADQARVLGLIENLQRESLGIMETAHGLAQLARAHDLTHEAIAAHIGKSRVYVSNFLRLRQLAEPVQQLLTRGQLSIGHGKALVGLEQARQVRLAQRAAAERVSVRRLEQWVRQPEPSPHDSVPTAANDSLTTLARQLSEHLGNQVQLHYDAERRQGELRIQFHDLDEFDGLLSQFGFHACQED